MIVGSDFSQVIAHGTTQWARSIWIFGETKDGVWCATNARLDEMGNTKTCKDEAELRSLMTWFQSKGWDLDIHKA